MALAGTLECAPAGPRDSKGTQSVCDSHQSPGIFRTASSRSRRRRVACVAGGAGLGPRGRRSPMRDARCHPRLATPASARPSSFVASIVCAGSRRARARSAGAPRPGTCGSRRSQAGGAHSSVRRPGECRQHPACRGRGSRGAGRRFAWLRGFQRAAPRIRQPAVLSIRPMPGRDRSSLPVEADLAVQCPRGWAPSAGWAPGSAGDTRRLAQNVSVDQWYGPWRSACCRRRRIDERGCLDGPTPGPRAHRPRPSTASSPTTASPATALPLAALSRIPTTSPSTSSRCSGKSRSRSTFASKAWPTEPSPPRDIRDPTRRPQRMPLATAREPNLSLVLQRLGRSETLRVSGWARAVVQPGRDAGVRTHSGLPRCPPARETP